MPIYNQKFWEPSIVTSHSLSRSVVLQWQTKHAMLKFRPRARSQLLFMSIQILRSMRTIPLNYLHMLITVILTDYCLKSDHPLLCPSAPSFWWIAFFLSLFLAFFFKVIFQDFSIFFDHFDNFFLFLKFVFTSFLKFFHFYFFVFFCFVVSWLFIFFWFFGNNLG